MNMTHTNEVTRQLNITPDELNTLKNSSGTDRFNVILYRFGMAYMIVQEKNTGRYFKIMWCDEYTDGYFKIITIPVRQKLEFQKEKLLKCFLVDTNTQNIMLLYLYNNNINLDDKKSDMDIISDYWKSIGLYECDEIYSEISYCNGHNEHIIASFDTIKQQSIEFLERFKKNNK
jgi:hypothetical protein